ILCRVIAINVPFLMTAIDVNQLRDEPKPLNHPGCANRVHGKRDDDILTVVGDDVADELVIEVGASEVHSDFFAGAFPVVKAGVPGIDTEDGTVARLHLHAYSAVSG